MAWYYKPNLETFHYSCYVDLNILNASVAHTEKYEIENINFAKCYPTWLKYGIYAVTKMDVEILVIHI